jgi:DNA-binding LacI/PurR family transcriptional regulator
VADLEYPAVASTVRVIEKELARRSLSLVVCNTDEDLEREELYVRLLLEEQMAGVIISPATDASPGIDLLSRVDAAVVTVDRVPRGKVFDSVLLDNDAASRLLVRDLLAHGHRRFLAVLGTTAATPSRERLSALRAELDVVEGASLETLLSGLGATMGVEQAAARIGAAVVGRVLAATDPPSAIICANAVMVVGVMEALRAEGIRVPEEVAVVGYDDMPGFGLFAAPVTVAAQSAEAIGRNAVDLLLQRLASPSRPRTEVRVPPLMLLRGSCGGDHEGGARKGH